MMKTHVKVNGKIGFIVSHPSDWETSCLEKRVLQDIEHAKTVDVVGEEFNDIADLEYDSFGNRVI